MKPASTRVNPVSVDCNREKATRNNTIHDYLLRSLLVCGQCGRRLIDAYQAGAIELAELQEWRHRSEEQNQLRRRRWAELQQQRQERKQEIRWLEGLDAFCVSIREALAEPAFATKQKVLELVVDSIVVEETKFTIRHIVLTGPVRWRTEPHVATTPP